MFTSNKAITKIDTIVLYLVISSVIIIISTDLLYTFDIKISTDK
jgi:hypothetical protein